MRFTTPTLFLSFLLAWSTQVHALPLLLTPRQALAPLAPAPLPVTPAAAAAAALPAVPVAAPLVAAPVPPAVAPAPPVVALAPPAPAPPVPTPPVVASPVPAPPALALAADGSPSPAAGAPPAPTPPPAAPPSVGAPPPTATPAAPSPPANGAPPSPPAGGAPAPAVSASAPAPAASSPAPPSGSPTTAPAGGAPPPAGTPPLAGTPPPAATPPGGTPPAGNATAPPAAGGAAPAAGNGKLVVAHHILGNTASYTPKDWADDIALAKQSGINGFALNIGPDPFTQTQVDSAYQAAQNQGPDFKLFFSFDMAVIPCQGPDDGKFLRDLIKRFAAHPNQLKRDGKSFASTFAGEVCKFGQGTPAQGWASAFTKNPEMTGENAVFFVPSFFVDPKTFGGFGDVMDGGFNFNGGWPVEATTESRIDPLTVAGSTASDQAFIAGLDTLPPRAGGAKPMYMAAVAPWFFTHFGAPLNKNFIFFADNHLYPTKWENLITDPAVRDRVEMVEIVTWNDFGESHYICPKRGSLPAGSEAWVEGFDHSPWLTMTAFFANAFRVGSLPTPAQDKLFLWARPHPKDAKPADPLGAPKNAELVSDKMFALALATAPGTVTLSPAPGQEKTFDVKAGVNKLEVEIQPGGVMKGSMSRGGTEVAVVDGKGFLFDGAPKAVNFNAFVAESK